MAHRAKTTPATRYRISSDGETLGHAWMEGGRIHVDSPDGDTEDMEDLIDSLRSSRLGATMSEQEVFNSIPHRLNNGYISAEADSAD